MTLCCPQELVTISIVLSHTFARPQIVWAKELFHAISHHQQQELDLRGSDKRTHIIETYRETIQTCHLVLS